MDENQTEDDAWSSVFNSSLLFFFSDFYTIKTFEVITDLYLDNGIIAFKSNSYSVQTTTFVHRMHENCPDRWKLILTRFL